MQDLHIKKNMPFEAISKLLACHSCESRNPGNTKHHVPLHPQERQLRWSFAVVLFIFIIALSSVLWAGSTQDKHKAKSVPATAKANEYTIHRQINYSFTLQNTTGHPARNVEFWTYAPVSRTATQRCDHIETSHPCEVIKDDLENQVLHFTIEEFPSFATKIIRISADLLIAVSPQPIPVGDVAPFLVSLRYIESDDPGILKTAKELSALSPFKSVENIYSWTSKNIRYTGYCPGDRGALFALKNREGDCTEYAYLFVALCRADKIPSRCLSGYVCRDNAILEPGRYHNWAEFYHDRLWQIADPQQNVFMRNQSDYIAMRIFGCPSDNQAAEFHRFKCSDEGIRVSMNGEHS